MVHPTTGWFDPEHTAAMRVVADPDLMAAALVLSDVRGATGTPWLARWTAAEARARAALTSVLAGHADATARGHSKSTGSMRRRRRTNSTQSC